MQEQILHLMKQRGYYKKFLKHIETELYKIQNSNLSSSQVKDELWKLTDYINASKEFMENIEL